MPLVSKGDKITCTNGHVIGEALRDLSPGDMPGRWAEAFGNWTQEDFPRVGEKHKPVCAVCGAPFIADNSWAFHYEDGTWR